MTDTLWEPEAAGEAGPQDVEATPAANTAAEDAAESEPAAEPRALTVSVNDFAGLEERVLRAVALVKQERHARTEAEERAERAEAALREQGARIEQMRTEMSALRVEREQVRTRVERLLEQLDALGL